MPLPLQRSFSVPSSPSSQAVSAATAVQLPCSTHDCSARPDRTARLRPRRRRRRSASRSASVTHTATRVAVFLAWQVHGVAVSGAERDTAGRSGPLLEHLVADLRRNSPCLLLGGADANLSPAGIDW